MMLHLSNRSCGQSVKIHKYVIYYFVSQRLELCFVCVFIHSSSLIN